MHARRLACFLLGIWIGGSVFIGAVAMQNFRSVDLLLEEPSPPVKEMMKRLGGEPEMRLLLRHQVAEQNRSYFETWELVQIILGLTLFGLLLFGTHEDKLRLGVCLSMVLLVVAMHWLVTPAIVGLGRELDFVDPDVNSVIRQQFRSRHIVYTSLELLKLGVGVLLGSLLIWAPARKRSAAIEHLDAMAMGPVR